jgi:hypothetical protein
MASALPIALSAEHTARRGSVTDSAAVRPFT